MDFICDASRAATIGALLGGLGLCLANCVRVPTPDNLAKGPQVDEIVRRVKCDLYEAVQNRLNAPYGYEWLHSWTAQANLNLIVNDQTQIAPGATFTQPLFAKTIPTKVTNFSQSANLGLGAQANNTATRNETIAFTVSMDELKAQFGNDQRNCDFPNYTDLRSELGLKDWVSASLSPVANGDLRVGYHKTPKSGSSAAAATANQAMSTGLSAAISTQGSSVVKGSPTISVAPPNCNWPSGKPSATADRAEIGQDLAVLICDLFTFKSRATPAPKKVTASPTNTPSAASNKSKTAAPGKVPGGATPPPPAAVHDLTVLTGPTVQFVAKTIADIQFTVRDLQTMGDASSTAATKSLEKTAEALAVFVDPPIDTISHQVQFIIVWNASASPSWTLLHFKGPSPSSGSLFSATKTLTHTLNIVMGPPSSEDSKGALAALQIGTAVGNALTTGGFVP
jgi:hypothetical protein